MFWRWIWKWMKTNVFPTFQVNHFIGHIPNILIKTETHGNLFFLMAAVWFDAFAWMLWAHIQTKRQMLSNFKMFPIERNFYWNQPWSNSWHDDPILMRTIYDRFHARISQPNDYGHFNSSKLFVKTTVNFVRWLVFFSFLYVRPIHQQQQNTCSHS